MPFIITRMRNHTQEVCVIGRCGLWQETINQLVVYKLLATELELE